MANQRFFYNNNGDIADKAAIDTSAGAGSAGLIPCLGGDGRLNINMMPTSIGQDVESVVASEALAAGDFVNLWNDTTLKCRKADATTNGKRANGFVLAAVDSGATASVYRQGENNQLTGMTIGAKQFLHTTAGGRTETAPSGSGNYVQNLGIAISATTVFFEERDGFTLA